MKTRLYVAAVFAGVIAVALLAVLVLGFGRFDPSPPSLAKNPVADIPGEILYIDEDDCIVRARASGERREQIRCAGPSINVVSWIDASTIGYATFGPGRPVWTELSLTTGRTTSSERFPQRQPPDQLSPRGERIDYDRDGSIYRVSDGERAKIVDFDSRNHERPSLVTWSPDGEWLLLRYKDELWIVKRDGSVRGTLAKTRPWPQEASWWIDGHGYLPRLDLRPTDGTFPPGR